MPFLEQISRHLNRGIEYLLFGLGITMAAIVAAQVFSRYVLNQSLFWSEELARFLLVWLTFLGASVAYYRGAHPGVDFLYSRMPGILRKTARLIVHGASLILFGVMIVHGCRFAWFIRLQISPALSLPKWIILSIVPISGTILMVHGLTLLARELNRSRCDD